MKFLTRWGALFFVLGATTAALATPASAPFTVPVEYHKLQLQLMDLHGLPEDYITTWVRKVYAVKSGDVQRVASKYIADDQATIVVAGDQKVIEEQLAPFVKK
ncbi:MAG: hypothetical protein ABJC07_08720 [Acidobacteriota bacterium]